VHWISIADRLPAGPVLIYADGECHVAELVGSGPGASLAFMDVHTCDILAWPSHWMEVPDAPLPAAAMPRARRA